MNCTMRAIQVLTKGEPMKLVEIPIPQPVLDGTVVLDTQRLFPSMAAMPNIWWHTRTV